jgi:hypothetical protein
LRARLAVSAASTAAGGFNPISARPRLSGSTLSVGVSLVRIQMSLVWAALVVTGLAWAIPAEAPVSLSDLPNFDVSLNPQSYRVDPFIRVAVALQSLDRSAALARLHAMAYDPRAKARVIILSRMLFMAPSDSKLRRPLIGGAIFLGGTNYSDWPQEPIEIVDGIPFLIANGYILAGLAESDESYLQYCETHGDWSTFRFSVRTVQEKREALRELLASDKWGATLTDHEQSFLAGQIE